MKLLLRIPIITLLLFCQLLIESKAQFQHPSLQLEENRGFFRSKPESPQNILRSDLPDNIEPAWYNLELRVVLDPPNPDTETAERNWEQWTAHGHVDIVLDVLESTNQVILHRHHHVAINENTTTITDTDGQDYPILTHTFVQAETLHTLTLKRDLRGGRTYKLSIDFITLISADTVGLYRGAVKDDDGIERRMAITQFEPSFARQAFPCFDEPRWKTRFTISLGYKNESYNTLSNGKKKITAEPDPVFKSWVWDHYETTVKMPTYLVAIFVSNFDFVQAPDHVLGLKSVRVYGEPRYIAPGGNKKVSGGNYAVNASAYLLSFLEKKYLFPYEMHKMDVVAIPRPFYYFQNLAMENWGLVTQIEDKVMFFEGEQSWSDKEQITAILSHELAHQWFGNLVTCRKWSHLWLNEGFATYVSNFGVQATHPEWDDVRMALWRNVQLAMRFDVTKTAPIISHNTPGVITYSKGASIIRMMQGFLGEQILTKGLISYLRRYAYHSVVQDQLFQKLTIQAQRNHKLPPNTTMKDIMDTWTLQPGFPLVRVYTGSESHVYISQERFQPANKAANDTAKPETEGKDIYYQVPIATATQDDKVFSNHTPRVWLTQQVTWTNLTHDTSKWIIVNPDAMGYYRVFYDDHMTTLIIQQLTAKRDAISGLSRSQLIDDYFELAKYDHMSISKALDMTTWIKNDEGIETDYVVWSTLFSSLSNAVAKFQVHNGGSNHSLKHYLLPRIEATLDVVGWTQQPHDKGTIVVYRAKLLDWACALGSHVCSFIASQNLKLWMANPAKNPFLIDVQPVMYCAAVRQGEFFETIFLFQQFEAAPVGTFRLQGPKLLSAQACVQHVSLLERLLGLSLTNSTLLGQNPKYGSLAIKRVATNILAKKIMLPYLDEHFERLVAKFGGVNFIADVLSVLSHLYIEPNDLADFLVFIDKRAVQLFPVRASVVASIENIHKNINWMQKYYTSMDLWFRFHI